MVYIPNTDDDRKQMLERIGVKSLDELFKTIPSSVRINKELDIPSLSEMELLMETERLSKLNSMDLTCFAGGGVYDHFIPSALETIVSRPEFMTAYTPYQAEVAQGTLQVIYEFQTHICRLTGMDVANASMYDGASAAAEALILSSSNTRRTKVIISETVNPLFREVIRTYMSGKEIELVTVPHKDGYVDIEILSEKIDDNTAAVLMAQPNFFGMLEDIENVEKLIHGVGGKLILSVDPIAQAVLKTPADYNVDIVVGEGQPLGIPVSFGGPLLGFFATKKELVRSMPGRIAARTTDVDGKEGFVLTLQTREQHIRREKATSNICTNQALCATAASVYFSLMGKEGLRQVAILSMEKTHETAEQIFAIDGFEPYFEGSYAREVAIKTPRPAQDIIMNMVQTHQVLPGITAGRWYDGLDDCLIVAVTEKRTEEEINKFVECLKDSVKDGVLSNM
jgi:glycine dehydrogenase subunit 1